MCLDETDFEGKPLERHVFKNKNEHKTFEVAIIPCIPKQLTPYNAHLVDKECIADYKAAPDSKYSLLKKFQASNAYMTEHSGRPNTQYLATN